MWHWSLSDEMQTASAVLHCAAVHYSAGVDECVGMAAAGWCLACMLCVVQSALHGTAIGSTVHEHAGPTRTGGADEPFEATTWADSDVYTLSSNIEAEALYDDCVGAL